MSNKRRKKGVLVYSGVVWNSIWSHSHELALALSKNNDVYFLELPKLNDKAHPNLFEKATYPHPKNLHILGSKKRYTSYNLLYLLIAQLFTINEFIKIRKKADVVMIYNIFDVLLLMTAKLLGKKIIYMYVDDYPELTHSGVTKHILKIMNWIFLKMADKVVCTALVLEKHAKTCNTQTVYLPNAVKKQDVQLIKKTIKKSKKQFVVGFLGALGQWVSIEYIIDSAKRYRHISFWVIGSGERFDELNEVKQKSKLDNIRLFGFVSHRKVYDLINQFDVAIIPFKINKITNAVSPIKLFEYWLCKKPVICSSTTELKQFKGKVLFANTSSEMTANINKLFKDPALAKQLGKLGYQEVMKKYNWERYASVYNAMVAEIRKK